MKDLIQKPNIIIIFSMIMLDQLIKFLIYHFFWGENYNWIIPLTFKPLINNDYSLANSLFQLNIGVEVHVIFIGIVLIAMISVYRFILSYDIHKRTLEIAFNLLISGSVCSLIDKIFWGGSLDYICLEGYFILDLKDIYICIAELVLIVLVIINRQWIVDFNFRDLITFIKKTIKES